MGGIIKINTGQLAVSDKKTIFSTGGIGSCVVICIYDDISLIGGMCHSMLPSRREVGDISFGDSDPKYVDEAIDEMVKKIKLIGGKKERLKAKIVGGSSMFSVFSQNRIGEKNIEAAREKLAEHGIPIISEEVGGKVGRTTVFNLENGVLEVIIKM